MSCTVTGLSIRSPCWSTARRRPRPISCRREIGVVALLEHAHHEDVRVVPALAQRRVREDEPHRLLERQQPLLVLEDQVVGVDVVGLAGSRRRVFAIFAVDRAAWSSCRSRSSPRGSTARGWPSRCFGTAVGLVEVELARGTSARAAPRTPPRTPGVVAEGVLALVVAVLGDLVDEEQRQHLDALREELALLVQVRADDLADLDAPLRVLGHVRSASWPATTTSPLLSSMMSRLASTSG